MEFTFCRGCYIFLKMIKDTNKEKMALLTFIMYCHAIILDKFYNLCKSLVLLTKTTIASVLKLVNRQDLKSCRW